MTEKQLKELIKSKELELKELKQQLKNMQNDNKVINNTIEYKQLILKNSDELNNIINTLDIKELKTIAKQGNIKIFGRNTIEEYRSNLITIINARQNKGHAFSE